jgi:hypothetical protein
MVMWYILYNSDLKINKDKKCKKGEGLHVDLHMVLTSIKRQGLWSLQYQRIYMASSAE